MSRKTLDGTSKALEVLSKVVEPSPAKPLDPKEYKEIQGIIDRRSKLVQAQLDQREREIRAEIEKQVELEFQPKIDNYEGLAEKLYHKLERVQKEIDKLSREAAVEGLSLSISVGGYGSGVEVSVLDARKEVQRRLERLKSDKGAAEINFKLVTMEAQEKLTLGQITSPEAREILSALPTIDDLMPINTSDVKALTSGK